MAGARSLDLEWTPTGFDARVPVRFDWRGEGGWLFALVLGAALLWVTGAYGMDIWLGPGQLSKLYILALPAFLLAPIAAQWLRHTGRAQLSLRGDRLTLVLRGRREEVSLADVGSMRVIGRTLRVELARRADWMLPLAPSADLGDVQELAAQVRAALDSARAHADDRHQDEAAAREALGALSRAAHQDRARDPAQEP